MKPHRNGQFHRRSLDVTAIIVLAVCLIGCSSTIRMSPQQYVNSKEDFDQVTVRFTDGEEQVTDGGSLAEIVDQRMLVVVDEEGNEVLKVPWQSFFEWRGCRLEASDWMLSFPWSSRWFSVSSEPVSEWASAWET